eukprot:COSAG03_NODE_3108_length_2212_cov_3.638429_3_plen_186_part_00
MALHQIYETHWGQIIDETVKRDETSRRLAETGEEAVIAERAARCGWRLSWQSCDVRAAKCVQLSLLSTPAQHQGHGLETVSAPNLSLPSAGTAFSPLRAVCKRRRSLSTRWTSGTAGHTRSGQARCLPRWYGPFTHTHTLPHALPRTHARTHARTRTHTCWRCGLAATFRLPTPSPPRGCTPFGS